MKRLPIIPTLSPSLIIGIIHIVAKLFHLANFPSSPFRRILGNVLDVVDRIVPLILNLVWDRLDFTDLYPCLSASVQQQARQESGAQTFSPVHRAASSGKSSAFSSILSLSSSQSSSVQAQSQ